MIETNSPLLYRVGKGVDKETGKVIDCLLFHNGKTYTYIQGGIRVVKESINMCDMKGSCNVNTISIVTTSGIRDRYSLCVSVGGTFLEKEVYGASQPVLTSLTVETDYLKVCTYKTILDSKKIVQTIFIYSTHINLNKKLESLKLV